ncbi:AraC family transcriptional regulator [Paenibacillus sp. PL2-23]|uniref:AraC family transcriptional regulator n=1 Tax=Paenibacillus sp. PL2-23 TaxID=2100729 RepID=UPI0030F63D05
MIKPGDIMRQLNQMNFKVLLAGHNRKGVNWTQEPYTHRFNSLWLISKGKATFVIDGVSHAAEPGKLFVVAPGTVVQRSTEEGQPLEFYFVRFTYTTSYEEEGRWMTEGESSGPLLLHGAFTIQNPLPLLHAFEQMCELVKRRSQLVIMRQRIAMLELLTLIVADLRSQIVTGHTNTVIEKTIDYMVNHYDKSITLDDLADMAGLSPSHFSRLFKKYAGSTPLHYLTQLRMDRAKELLTLSDYRMKAIAQSIGYADELYFSRMFKKMVGTSPKEYARTHKASP